MLIADSEEGVQEKYRQWKHTMKDKDLRMNVENTNRMINSVTEGCVRGSGEWPCAVCRRGVSCKSVTCNESGRSLHERCTLVVRDAVCCLLLTVGVLCM